MVTKTANYDLSSRNTFRMRVRCALYVEVTAEEDLLALDWASLPQPVMVMGGGSNLLFTQDFPGTVLHVAADTTAFGGTPFASLSPAPPTADAAGPSPYPCAGVHMSSGEHLLRITGRGSCDAKGQLFAMYTACKELEASGCTDFGLLLLAGEETGSWGAKAFSKTGFQAPFLIVGEPTENKMVSASKGTKSYDLTFHGEAFHSGYPQYGVSAVDLFNTFYNQLKAKDFGEDPVLGATTWNVGLVHSDNPQNILSPELSCRLYFRTTFVSDQPVQDWMQAVGLSVTPDLIGGLTVTARGGDAPARYVTLPGFESAPVAFGSDAPHLTGFGHKIICGPGTIRVAHRPDEHVLVHDLETAVAQYVKMYREIQSI